MLPSGNDAAVALAENFGTLLRELKMKNSKTVVRSGIDNEIKTVVYVN